MGIVTLEKNYKKDIFVLISITLLLVLFDQITKLYVFNNLQGSAPLVIFDNFLRITFVMNPGAAFGFLADKSESIRHPFLVTLTSAAIIFIFYFYLTLKKEDTLAKVSLAMILGGAIGNLIDRVRLKAVIDFIDAHYYEHHWPAFNIADSLITIGIALMIIDLFKKKTD